MEVTKDSFNRLLPKILQDISDCCCVALDFEFSGIFNQQQRTASSYTDGSLGLQKRYEEVKEAAEKYQILQIGLTFVVEEAESGTYSLRPYNFPLSPILDPKMDVERNWSYQSSAVEFLMRNGFRMEAPFTEGIPYVSRAEEKKAKENAAQSRDISDINLETLDPESAEFLKETRRDIEEWIERKDEKENSLNIPHITPNKSPAMPLILSNYQKRLVHQIVRTDYPTLVTAGRKTFVRIIPYDKEREDKLLENKMIRIRRLIREQSGFRWIFEALAGGDLSRLDLRFFLSPEDWTTAAEGEKVSKQSESIKRGLKSARPVLVGHNLFTDLVNFYRCFIGELPEQVEDFQHEVHELFPLVVDTKYMATHNGALWESSSSLMNLHEALSQGETPAITVDVQHTNYSNRKPEHEAGYDSFITAQIFLKLSGLLYQNGDHFGKRRDRSRRQNFSKSMKDDGISKDAIMPDELINSSNEPKNVASEPSTAQEPLSQEKDHTKDNPKEIQGRPLFAHSTKFDLLSDEMDSDSTSSVDEVDIEQKVESGELIPRFDGEFWKLYGNKLRVFGTAEEICDLNEQPRLPASSTGDELSVADRALAN